MTGEMTMIIKAEDGRIIHTEVKNFQIYAPDSESGHVTTDEDIIDEVKSGMQVAAYHFGDCADFLIVNEV